MFLVVLFMGPLVAMTQSPDLDFVFRNQIHVVIDGQPSALGRNTLVLFALPNGNTIPQTMGRRLKPGDDWHFDIQHIKAQSAFIRQESGQHYVIVYLENTYRSWPRWKQVHEADFREQLKALVDTIQDVLGLKKFDLHLSAHSGGGSFLFGLFKAWGSLPPFLSRITFLDSNYGYDSSYLPILAGWIKNKSHQLTVFAYNDSLVQYNGKPLVSPKGGTWFKSHEMMKDFGYNWRVEKLSDSLDHFQNPAGNVNFFLINNAAHGILHTVQVERNGFIHGEMIGTPWENRRYRYFGDRAYTGLIAE